MREVFDRYTERWRVDRRARPMAAGDGVLTTHRQARVGSLDGVGDAAQPRLPRTGRVRQDEDRRAPRRSPTRTTRARGERHGRRADQPRSAAPSSGRCIPVPPLITDETFELAQARLQEQHALRQAQHQRARRCCRASSSAASAATRCYRTSTRTTNKRIYYYRCIGSDNYRHAGGRVCYEPARSAPTSSTRSSGARSDGC